MEYYKDKRKRTVSVMLEHRHYNHKQDEESPRIRTIVNSIFKKSFTIINNERYKLPKPESMFVEIPWQVEELQKIKIELNETKSKLNNYHFAQWHQHTSQRNKAKDIEWTVRRDFDPEFVTQAWCKFHEIVNKYPLVPKENIFSNNNRFTSLHLCEAPGAFVTCLNHWLKTNLPTVYWDWLAMTFNPYYEGNCNTKMISDDRFIMYTLRNWFFGKDNTGNLMTPENLDALIERSESKGKIYLITADGSVNCINNPGEQEGIVSGLHYCEMVAAMHILQAGGNFLLKIFTVFEHQSICLIYFLSCVFEKIHFYKPVTSKEGNSEVYMICLNFKGSDYIASYLPILKKQYGKNSAEAMFRKDDIPENFIQQIIQCADTFKKYQCEVIENNIAAYNSEHDSSRNFENKKIAKLVADKFLTEFPLQKLHVDLNIVGNVRLKKNKSNNWVVAPAPESFNERQIKQFLEPVSRLLTYQEQLKSIEPNLKTLTFKPSNVHFDTHIDVGKPYNRIQNSRFCSVQISEIYNLFYQTIEMEKDIPLQLPTEGNSCDYKAKIHNAFSKPCHVIHFYYTTPCKNNDTIACIKKVLENLKVEDNLVLTGYHFLTQFNVGLIYLLTQTFESVEFNTNEQIGCSVIFKCFKNRESVLQKIQEIYETSKTAAMNNSLILSIISVVELYGSDLFTTVSRLNSWIAKYCINYISSIYKDEEL